MKKKKITLKPNWMRNDTSEGRQRVVKLGKRIEQESNFIVKPYVNSRQKVILNLIDPKSNIPPFVVRDEAEWDDKRPRKVRADAADEIREEA